MGDGTQKGDDVKIQVTDLTQMTALKNSPTEKKVAQRLESVIKQKLSKAGLDTGGRQIEVKLVTTTSIGGDGNDEDKGLSAFNGDEEKDMSSEEQQQFQNMVYNLMIGNTAAYEDIDRQRRSERNYKFAWDEDLLDKTSEDTKSVRDALGGVGDGEEATSSSSTQPTEDTSLRG